MARVKLPRPSSRTIRSLMPSSAALIAATRSSSTSPGRAEAIMRPSLSTTAAASMSGVVVERVFRSLLICSERLQGQLRALLGQLEQLRRGDLLRHKEDVSAIGAGLGAKDHGGRRKCTYGGDLASDPRAGQLPQRAGVDDPPFDEDLGE
jgi:hypothetical protein